MSDDGHFIPDISPFVVERFGAHVEIAPCAAGTDQWHWTYIPDDHPETVMQTLGFLDPATGQPAMREVPWEPVSQHTPTPHLLACLTPEEARLFMGWCAHITEHITTHKLEVVKALDLAVQENRQEGIETLTNELYAANALHGMVTGAAQAVYDGS